MCQQCNAESAPYSDPGPEANYFPAFFSLHLAAHEIVHSVECSFDTSIATIENSPTGR